eukprot:scaffold127434_cov57-Phaeocystis_antarctica.AAC.5
MLACRCRSSGGPRSCVSVVVVLASAPLRTKREHDCPSALGLRSSSWISCPAKVAHTLAALRRYPRARCWHSLATHPLTCPEPWTFRLDGNSADISVAQCR